MNWQGPVLFSLDVLFSPGFFAAKTFLCRQKVSLLPKGSFATNGRMIAAVV